MPELTTRLNLALPPEGSGRKIALLVTPDDLRPAAERLLRQDWFLEDICGLDLTEGRALLYHFAHWTRPGRIVLRLLLPHEEPACPTIEDIYPGASWHEREARDFFGVVFTNASNTTPLLLAEALDPPPLLKQPDSRMSRNVIWPLSEWVGSSAKGHAVVEELMSAGGDCAGQEDES